MTRVVVIGEGGQVGTSLTELPPVEGRSIITVGQDQMELTEPETFADILSALAPDVLINAAAYTAVDKAEAEEDLAMIVNADAPGALARVAADLDIPFLHISTDYVFDGRAGRPWLETDTPAPLNAYGRSKLAGERLVLDSGARAAVLRTSWVFSAIGANFVKTMLRLGAERTDLSIVADQIGGPTSADDIAATLMTIAEAMTTKPAPEQAGVFHYSSTPVASWADFAGAIFDAADWITVKPAIQPIATKDYRTAAARPLNSVLDCGKIARVFGIEQPDWRLALARVMAQLDSEQV